MAVMIVKAVKSFGSSKYGHRAEGSVFELPDGVDWLQAGFVVPFEPEVETASLEASEKAVRPKARKRRVKSSNSADG